MNKIEVTLEWENNNKFEMVTKLNEHEPVSIVEIHENGRLDVMWVGIKAACMNCFESYLNQIGKEMKA